jgi:four helix bundle protein
MKNYKDLTVWQKSFQLTLLIYKITKTFPKDERFELVSQMHRAAVSIPSNIAEGYSRKTTKEFIRFILISYGSINELETQLLIAKELNFIQEDVFLDCQLLLEEVSKMLNALVISLKKKLV